MQQTIAYTDDVAVARKLDNGMTVTIERLPHLHSCAVGVWIKTGSANETERQSGISHFLEHLLFKGTETRSARELVEAVERKGGQLNAYTARDYTCVYVKTLDTHVHTGIEILADMVKHSKFCDLEKERNVVLEEIASIEDVPEEFVHEIAAEKLWPDHPMGRGVSGIADRVAALSLGDIREYFTAWYRPQDMFFSIAGNFDETAVLDQVAKEFGPMTPGTETERTGPPAYAHGVHIVPRDIAQNHLCMGFPGPRVQESRRYVYEVLNSALGGGSMSRLFERIREDEGLAYSIYSFHSAYQTAGVLGVYAAVAPQNLRKTADLAFEELRRFRDEPMSADELDMNREQLKGNMLMALENTFVRMSRLAKSMMYFGRLIGTEEAIKAVDAVTVDDVQALAREIFQLDKALIVSLGPAEEPVFDSVPL
ncbi:MAG: hypothetical protein QG656_859 [Candidatus Hydrogenedentes bacterium]|nr:hypothetical protein [Candidatus Hydrogenedentota bacterium]